MFGNVTSSWANPQQGQQQQQQTPGAFGQPSVFGATNTSTNAFGSTSAFGQPQQQQQPQANPMFGNLGTPANNTGTTSAFGGGFGTTANASTGAFGAKPATSGFGTFGGGGTTGTGAFGGGTGAFGQPANTTPATTGLFGQPAATTTSTTTPFGSSNLFGQNKPSAFGAAIGTTNPPVITTGTQNPPYAAHHEKDGNATSQYQAISCMPAYLGYSFDELRVQDYAQGRKTASSFGQSTAFGTSPAATQPTTSLFGATQPAQPTNSVFGAPANPAPAATGFGGFGANTNTTQTAGTGLFGSGGFGATAQQPAQTTSTFGGFGAQPQQQPQQSTGLFGSTTFGSTAPKPAFGGFGTGTATTTSAFGSGTGAFGAQNTQQPAQPTANLFGAAQPAQANNPFGSGAFGATANKPLFGSTATTTAAPAATGFGGFGTQPTQQQPQQGTSLFGSGTGLFGQQQNQQPAQQAAGTGLFGNAQPQQQAGTGLFGSGSNLFGNNQQNQQQQQAGFGLNKPAAPASGLFGSSFGQQQAVNAGQTGGGLFGNSMTQPANQQSGFGGGLFGKPAAPNLGISTSTGQPGGLFASTMGNSTNLMGSSAAPVQGTLTASIAQPIGSNLPIFSMLPPGPRLVDLDQSQPKKKPPFFVDVPTRSPIPRVQQNFAPANSKLRGFGASTAGQTTATGNPFAGSVSFLQGKPNALLADSRSGSVGPESILGRSGSPALGSGSRQSVKKVILDKKVEPSQLFIKSGSPVPGGKIVFSPALSIAARESEAAAAAAVPKGGKGNGGQQHLDSPTPAPRAAQKSPNRFTAPQSSKNVEHTGGDPSALEEGDYWLKPDLASLKKLGYDELSAYKGLIVGRVGYGEIEFLEPVDLTGLPKLGALLGEVIHFEDKECSVYPDSEDADKPPPGSGLNVKAKLTLERCWAVDKATREPITDATHPSVVKHLKRLKNMKDTHFQGFDMATGKWTFIVDHF